jgi:hypothetical protein
MPYYHHSGHSGQGRHGPRHGGFWRRPRPWLFRHPHPPPFGGDGDDDGDADQTPPSPSPPSFPFPFPLPSLEAEAERHHRWRRWRPDDQETGLNEEPAGSRDHDQGRQKGRWIRKNGKLILFGV